MPGGIHPFVFTFNLFLSLFSLSLFSISLSHTADLCAKVLLQGCGPCVFGLQFKSAANRGQHIYHKHPEYHIFSSPDRLPLRAKKRTRFTNAQKAHALDKFYEFLLDPTCSDPYTSTVKFVFGAAWKRKGYLSKWLKQCGVIRDRIKAGRGGKTAQRNGMVRPSAHPDCEDELYIRFIFRRTALGYPCNHFWLISEFKKGLTETKPAIWDGKAMTKKWAVNFCHRFNMTTQSKNNIKETDQVDRL